MARLKKPKTRCVKPHPQPIRPSRPFMKLVNQLKVDVVIQNRNAGRMRIPSTTKITDMIAKYINKKGLYNELVRQR